MNPSTNDATRWPGLAPEAVEAARAIHGFNELPDAAHRGPLDTVRDIATEPMFVMLLAAASLYLLLGDRGEGLLLFVFALVTVGLVLLQERRSERALDALRALAAPRARACRGGLVAELPARELVPGDVVWVSEGERVAADARLLSATALCADESLLTGESVPVDKAVDAADEEGRLLRAGTLVTAGHAVAEVVATGRHTAAGRIGAALAGVQPAPTPMERQLQRVVRRFGLLALLLTGLLVAWYGLVRGDWLHGLLSGLAMGMGMLPEEFPMAMAIFLAMGAWRLAREQVLVRRPAVVQGLGAITLLAVDKTGTLTENRMRVRVLADAADEVDLSSAAPVALDADPWRTLLHHAAIASRAGAPDPMDRALTEAAAARGLRGDGGGGGSDASRWTLLREYPLQTALPAMAQAWDDGEGGVRLAAKGAPEAVVDLCHLPEVEAAAWRARARSLAARGWRVLGVAQGTGPGRPHDGSTVLHDHDFLMLGLVAFEDPLRPGVAAAVAQARAAGVQVAMITGDHPATAMAIAAEAGIDTAGGVLTGPELDAMDDDALAAASARVRVVARVRPEQKLRLVRAFQARGETVAMTGDGVNDAPALKAAHVGIAMGRRGTDVAREAAAMVLLDDDFAHLVAGIRRGRRIVDNLGKVMTYIVAVHVPIAGLALLPVLLGWPPLLLPVHVVLMEMVIDPACSLAFEGAPEAPDVMTRPPRRADAGLLDGRLIGRALAQGGAVLAAAMAACLLARQAGLDEAAVRLLGVTAMVAGNLALIAANLAEGLGARALLGPDCRVARRIAAGTLAVLVLGVSVPGARHLLQVALPGPGAIAAAALAAVAGVLLAQRATRSRRT